MLNLRGMTIVFCHNIHILYHRSAITTTYLVPISKFVKMIFFHKGLCDFKSVGRPRSRSETVIARRLKISGLVGLGHGI